MVLQQKFVVVSLVWSVCIGIGIAVYIFKTKKHPNFLVILVLCSLLPLVSLLRPGSYESGDFTIHIYRSMALYQSLQDGVFPANWAGVLNATYGYPLFNFIYPLPYYTVAFFHFIGFSFVTSLKLFIALTFVTSGISMYCFLKSFLRPFYAFVGGIFYLFAPYHLVNMHFRVDIGEIAAIAFVPLLFLFTSTLLKKYDAKTLVFLSLTICAVILSHQAVSLAIFPFLGAYILVLFFTKQHTLKDLFPLGISVLLGLLLSSFYVLPVLFELQFTQQHLFPLISFEAFWKLFYSPWRYGLLFQGPQGKLAYPIGYIQVILLVIALFLLWMKKMQKDQKPMLIFSLCAFVILVFMMLEVSKPLWYSIPLIKNFQFSYRLMAVVIFFTSIIAALVCQYLPRKLVYIVLFMTIFSTILNWGNRRVMPEITDTVLSKNLPYSTFQGEGLVPAAPRWVDTKTPWFMTPPKEHLKIIQGTGKIQEVSRTTTSHVYTVQAKTSLRVAEHTVFFPGWNILIHGKPIPVHISEIPNSKGALAFTIPKGFWEVHVVYMPTLIRKIGIGLSLLGIVTCLAFILFGHKKYSIKL